MKKRRAPRNNDSKALASIEDAGWKLTGVRAGEVGRFVAAKRLTEDDDSVTKRYESAYTLEDLAKQVVRREREERR